MMMCCFWLHPPIQTPSCQIYSPSNPSLQPPLVVTHMAKDLCQLCFTWTQWDWNKKKNTVPYAEESSGPVIQFLETFLFSEDAGVKEEKVHVYMQTGLLGWDPHPCACSCCSLSTYYVLCHGCPRHKVTSEGCSSIAVDKMAVLLASWSLSFFWVRSPHHTRKDHSLVPSTCSAMHQKLLVLAFKSG